MQREPHQRFDGRLLAQEVLAKIKDYVAHATRPLIESLDRHPARQESADQLIVDLDRRASELEARR